MGQGEALDRLHGELLPPRRPHLAFVSDQPAPARWESHAACLPQGAFWGADLVGEGGLLERLYAGLALPRRVWLGLKRLPEVAGIADAQRRHYMALVANHLKARPHAVVCLQEWRVPGDTSIR